MIRAEREALGLSTRDLARLAGVSYPTISRIENGHQHPRWDTLSKIAAALGKSLAPTLDRQPLPRLADLADQWSKNQPRGTRPDWTQLRAFVDHIALHPEYTAAAIAPDVMPSGSRFIDNLLAATAEKLADDRRIRRPAWTKRFPPLTTPWTAPGTPRKQTENAARTPSQFASRNITLPASAIWRDREPVLA